MQWLPCPRRRRNWPPCVASHSYFQPSEGTSPKQHGGSMSSSPDPSETPESGTPPVELPSEAARPGGIVPASWQRQRMRSTAGYMWSLKTRLHTHTDRQTDTHTCVQCTHTHTHTHTQTDRQTHTHTCIQCTHTMRNGFSAADYWNASESLLCLCVHLINQTKTPPYTCY